MPANAFNAGYLATKQERAGHLLGLVVGPAPEADAPSSPPREI